MRGHVLVCALLGSTMLASPAIAGPIAGSKPVSVPGEQSCSSSLQVSLGSPVVAYGSQSGGNWTISAITATPAVCASPSAQVATTTCMKNGSPVAASECAVSDYSNLASQGLVKVGATADDRAAIWVRPGETLAGCIGTWNATEAATPAGCGDVTVPVAVSCVPSNVQSGSIAAIDSMCAASGAKPASSVIRQNYSACSYSLDHGAWTAYNYSCGPAMRSKQVGCRNTSNVPTAFTDTNCGTAYTSYCATTPAGVTCGPRTAGMTNTVYESVNLGACDAASGYVNWDASAWSAWSTTCGSATRTRTVRCYDSRNGLTVADSMCTSAKPVAAEAAYISTGCVANGVCGPADGGTFSSVPTTGTCSSGLETGMADYGSVFIWNCSGTNGGGMAGCMAYKASSVNGSCGSANGVSTSTPPWSNGSQTCATGTRNSEVQAASNYTWSCSGSGGGTTANCSAPYVAAPPPPVNGQCGTANGVTSTNGPWTTGAQTCAVGTTYNTYTGGGQHSWSCSGSNGGNPAYCSAPQTASFSYSLVHGAYGAYDYTCGPASHTKSVQCRRSDGTMINFSDSNCTTQANNYCSSAGAGISCGAIGTGSSFNVTESVNRGTCDSTSGYTYWQTGGYGAWSTTCGTATRTRSVSCYDSRNNATVADANCSGTKPSTTESSNQTSGCITNAVCGSAHNTPQASAPWTSGAQTCAAGTIYNTSSGGGLYNWSCAGSNGGSNAFCSAPQASAPVNGACGSAQGSTYSTAPWTIGAQTCSAGTRTNESNTGTQWTWTCAGQNGGTTTNCTATRSVDGACGSAGGVGTVSPPWTTGAQTCSAGSTINTADTGTNYTWSCGGTSGGTTANCTAPKNAAPVTGQCGTANNVSTTNAPWTTGAQTCSPGTLTNTADNGTNYSWTCAGSNGGGNANCTAPKNVTYSYSLVHGAYGAYNYVCGPATHTKSVTCRRSDGTMTNFSDANCTSAANAYCSSAGAGISCGAIGTGSSFNVTESVNRGTCDSTSGFTGWVTGSYGAWSTTCGNATRTRSVQCWDSRNNVGVPDANCLGTKPATTESANQTSGCAVNGACASPPATGNAPWDAGHAICTVGNGINGGVTATTWTWQCAGSNGGTTANCSSGRIVNGACNTATTSTATAAAPWDAGYSICSSGNGTNGGFGASPPTWTWQCAGANGGTTANCSNPRQISGSCGSANGVQTSSAPTTNLCNSGDWGSVSDTGSSFAWSCNGVNGGTTATCSAPKPAAPVTPTTIGFVLIDTWSQGQGQVWRVSYQSHGPGVPLGPDPKRGICALNGYTINLGDDYPGDDYTPAQANEAATGQSSKGMCFEFLDGRPTSTVMDGAGMVRVFYYTKP